MKPVATIGIVFLLLLVVFLVLIRDLYMPGEDRSTVFPDKEVTDFERCEAAGNPIMESYPRQCRWENGTTVVEVI